MIYNASPQHSCLRRLAPLGTLARPALQRSDPIRICSRPLTSVCPLESCAQQQGLAAIRTQSRGNATSRHLLFRWMASAIRPCMQIPTDLPQSRDPPERDVQRPAATATNTESSQTPDEEARDIFILAKGSPEPSRGWTQHFQRPRHAQRQRRIPQITRASHKNFPRAHHNSRQSCCTVCPRCLTRGRLPK